jgi:hypothetical protein
VILGPVEDRQPGGDVNGKSAGLLKRLIPLGKPQRAAAAPQFYQSY